MAYLTVSSIAQIIQGVPGRKVNILRLHSIGHSKQIVVYYVCPIPNDFRGRAMDVIACISKRQDALRRATRHVLTRAAKCIDVEGGIFESVLNW
jgi:hypothetical protein